MHKRIGSRTGTVLIRKENGERRFGPDFWIVLIGKKIRTKTSLKTSNPKFNEKN